MSTSNARASDAHLFDHAILPRAELDALLAKYQTAASGKRGAQSKRAISVRNQIVESNMRLVAHVARRYHPPRGLDREDLHSYGVIGLVAAIERFDLSHGTAFSTYATWWIRHAIQRAIADLGHAVRVPVHAQDALRSEERGKCGIRKLWRVEIRKLWRVSPPATQGGLQ